MLEVLGAEPLLANRFDGYAPPPTTAHRTKFGTRGLKLGRSVAGSGLRAALAAALSRPR